MKKKIQLPFISSHGHANKKEGAWTFSVSPCRVRPVTKDVTNDWGGKEEIGKSGVLVILPSPFRFFFFSGEERRTTVITTRR